jgi:fluoroacetyl-CoA thioesterase
MKNPFQIGDQKLHHYKVKSADLAGFGNGVVHPVCSTFALGREMEWSSRQFALDMFDDDEEGVGTFLQIQHNSPAVEGEVLLITATLSAVKGHEILCKIEVKVKNRLIATGETGQKILKRAKIASLLEGLGND